MFRNELKILCNLLLALFWQDYAIPNPKSIIKGRPVYFVHLIKAA